jgi:6-phosphogluconolactonase
MTMKRVFTGVLYAAIASASMHGFAADKPGIAAHTEVYASVGEELRHYSLTSGSLISGSQTNNGASLKLDETLRLPATIQFAVADRAHRHLYVISSNISATNPGDVNLLNVFTIDQHSGRLTALGSPVNLKERPIHLTLDREGRYALVAYNKSATLSVHPIEKDGQVGAAIEQQQPVQAGIFTHQVTVMPSNKFVIAAGRGNDAAPGHPEDVGTLTTFTYTNGQLGQGSRVEFEPTVGPRHVAYAPKTSLAYVATERGSKIYTYKIADSGQLAEHASFKTSTLDPHWKPEADEGIKKGGVIQLSPDGKFLYVTNRSDETVSKGGQTVFKHGENDIVTYALDAKTGEPKLLQHIDSQGIEARTFAVLADQHLLIVGNQKSGLVTKDGKVLEIKANLAVFKIRPDGRLKFVEKYEISDPTKSLMWVDAYSIGG